MEKYRSLIANCVAFGPIILYNVYFFLTKESGRTIDFAAILFSAVIGIISFTIAKTMREKRK